MAKTLFDKIWDMHCVSSGTSDLLYVDRVFLHERTGSVALQSLAERGRHIANTSHAFCTMDHIIDTHSGRGDQTTMPGGTDFITTTRASAKHANIKLYDINDREQGISHLISAEQGITLPGLVVVCPDSHTCTLGALGALAWGIGSSECEHVLATQTISVGKPPQMLVQFNGELADGVSAKDIMLHLIKIYGSAGGKNMAIEFSGDCISALGMDERFTLCNMATEFSGFCGIIRPDATTVSYVENRKHAPTADTFNAAKDAWATLYSDASAIFDHTIRIDVAAIQPLITWGTNPEQAIPVDDFVPAPTGENTQDAMTYMGLRAGQQLVGMPIQGAFIGSCTNGRINDLRQAAKVLLGKKVATGVTAICTPASQHIKRHAEALGLDKVFKDAGFQWREPGCSLCFYAGGEGFDSGARVVSSTNRNFIGRQGPGVKTHITSPAVVAASAVAGAITAPTLGDA